MHDAPLKKEEKKKKHKPNDVCSIPDKRKHKHIFNQTADSRCKCVLYRKGKKAIETPKKVLIRK